ncbi:putative metal-binding motif-containing protein [Myxococcota bacterium]|nr:putative metal-binding motif-containing protein [Myxococcota bacterium]
MIDGDDTARDDDDTHAPDNDTSADDDATTGDDDSATPGDDDTGAGADDSGGHDDDTLPGDDDSASGDDDSASGDDDSASDDDDSGWPWDVDGDGYWTAWDCDDANPTVHPLATELCDGLDNDCDGFVDEGLNFGADTYRDADGDGGGDLRVTATETACGPPVGYVWEPTDCDDGSAGVHAGASESCDGVDQDCDGLVDEGFDNDLDGFSPCAGDCDDLDAAVSPGAPEDCDGMDTDCDGSIDDETTDGDGDGFTACSGDCDDRSAAVAPGARDDCNDPVDSDCDPSNCGRRLEGSMVPYGDPILLPPVSAPGDDLAWPVEVVGDVDGDGWEDLVVASPCDTWEEGGAVTGEESGAAVYVLPGPFDGFARVPEPITRLGVPSGEVEVWEGGPTTVPTGDLFCVLTVASGDFDGDGALDLAVGLPDP